MIDEVKEVFGIQSPSKVFRTFGTYSIEGYTEGLEEGIPQTTNVLNKIIPTTTAAQAATNNTGSKNIGDISIHIQASEGMDTTQLAQDIRLEMMKLFDEMSLESGTTI